MIRIHVTTRDGETREIAAEDGQSMMEAIRAGGIDELTGMCGGCCSCATCHVYLDKAAMALVGEASGDESDLLEGSDYRRHNSRLSCQIAIAATFDGTRVTIAPED